MKHSLWTLLLLIPLGGCTSVATFLAADHACSRENVYCGKDRQEERAAAEEVAEQAFKYDQMIYRKITGKPTEPAENKSITNEITYCRNDEEKVCISNSECKCI